MKTLYNNLLKLTIDNASFFFKDFELDSKTFRIFNYRLASYTEFQLPGAMEARGIMFEVDDDEYVDLVCRPMAKFHNLHEIRPQIPDLDLSKVVRFMEKADGSLISSYFSDKVRLKSKGALFSGQAIDSTAYLYSFERLDLLSLIEFVSDEYTVNMEWCSPDNCIVLNYVEPELKILNIRHKYTGKYLPLTDTYLSEYFDIIEKYKVDDFVICNPEEFILMVPDMKESIEGFVCEMEDGLLFKIKTLGYIALHHSKDSINSDRRLYEAVLEEVSDDLKLLFGNDLLAIKRIEDMEIRVEQLLNTVIQTVEDCYNTYKDLDRKHYAIQCQKELLSLTFSLAMNLYLGKDNDYKMFMKKRWKEFGLKDKEVNDEL